ncbi:MAG TPA: hypothetical protein EYP41_00800, partial [Anaerolineae bacterium]|nr:hypothetical protein [Anaerolineae bacterium]
PLIDLWLDSWRITPGIPRGFAMGSPLSPLLSNIYLHRLDMRLLSHGLKVVRIADDFIVLTAAPPDWRRSYRQTEAALTKLKLTFEPRKTKLTTFAEGFDFLGVHFEETWYWYIWGGKRIKVRENQTDPWLDYYDAFY